SAHFNKCAPGYLGEYCHLCGPEYCLNRGNCTVNRVGKSESPSCVCPLGFNGPRCETQINSTCYPNNPCSNGGTCALLPNDKYTCHCTAGWTGMVIWLYLSLFCTDDVDECRLQPNACQNGGTCSNMHGGYTCVCVNGWSGLDCSENIDDCAVMPCTAGSTCLDRVASFFCSCPFGKTGEDPVFYRTFWVLICVCVFSCSAGLLCHIDDACISNPCKAGSQCDTNPVNGKFNCNCPSGYKGTTCNDDINECTIGPNPCEHGGTCVNTEGSFTCQCARGYSGPRCEQDVNECGSNPCQNDATCLDQIGDYTCICMPGFEGSHCEIDVDECASSPCLNGGTCLNQVSRFICDCPKGFSGEMCQVDIDECASTPCQNGAYCIDRPNGYECYCSEGYSGPLCNENINDCDPEPCHHGTCVDGIATYTCECEPGFMGPKCSEQINECHSNPCQNGGRCINLVNKYFCNCLPGTSGELWNIHTHTHAHTFLSKVGLIIYIVCVCVCVCVCVWSGTGCSGISAYLLSSEPSGDLLCSLLVSGVNCEKNHDECASNPCQHGTCVDGINKYKCVCEPGYTGERCSVEINECESNPCLSGGTCEDKLNGFQCHCPAGTHGLLCHSELVPCASQPCRRGGVCQPSLDYTSYTCRCPSGWQGAQCTVDVDECRKSPCQNGAQCVNTQGSYVCKCLAGYSGVNCQTNIDDCSSNPCINGGSCVDKVGRFSCECRPGFSGERCEEEVNECESSPCRHGGTCTDYVNSYTCQCPPGFNGINCERNIPECTETSCLNNGTCVDGINRFSCRCRPGFTGSFCQFEINECESQPCKNGGTCTDALRTYSCTCPMEYSGNNCEFLANLCLNIQCKNGGECVQQETRWSCRCPSGWSGLYCDIPNVSCQTVAQNKGVPVDRVCQNGGHCENTGDSHKCHCQVGWEGSYCENEINECLSSPCRNGGICRDFQGSYDCQCKAGYQGRNCEYDVNECQSNPCRHGGTCINLVNRFSCSCPPGTKGLQCEVNIDECSLEFPPRCLNGGRCVDGVGRYTCVCPHGFTGDHCEGDINECLSAPCNAQGSVDCVQMANDYKCRCRLVSVCVFLSQGYTGFNCGDIEAYTCANLRCQNGGRCQEVVPGHLQCQCPTGFLGTRCEILPTPACQCQNGGMCYEDIDKRLACHCPSGFSGEHCQISTRLTPPTSSCPYVECKNRTGDRVCDPQCKNQECEWDGGDCTLHWSRPWENCTASVPCWDRFHNGLCDPECDNAGCLFDSFECQTVSPSVPRVCKYDQYCLDHYQNGHCNQGCNTEECGWDGLDCSVDTPPQLADGTLIVVVLLQPKELLGDLKGFLRSLGTLLRTNLRVKMDNHQKLMVYPYYRPEQDPANTGSDTTKRRGKRELEHEVIGSKVYLEIDNRQCAQNSEECFTSTNLAASYIAAEYLKADLPYPLFSVDSNFQPLIYLVGVAVAIILLILVLGVLAAKRKRKHGVLWLPDGFLPKKDSKRREPVGQDDFGLKNLQKTPDVGLMDGSAGHHWPDEEHLHKKPRLEDKPLLPLGVDAGVDRREWTLQHRKAADITLTPPQADIDMDCLDVNVKGPDGFTPLMLASLRNGGSLECGSVLAEEEEESGVDEPGTNMITDLITQGATLNAQTDRTGETALHLAARYARADAAKRLLDAGADPNAHDNMGRTPLHAAVAADAQGVFQILIRNRATELDSRMNDGTTPLILAARLAVEGMVEELVHCHADVNAVDDHGKSALHWAAAVNNVEATLVLLKNGANRDMQDNKEETPLFLAAREGSFEAAQVLLDHYSNRDITDHLDRLPRDTAQERMHHDIVRLLDQYNLVHSPHSGPNHMGNGGGGHPSMVCGNGNGYIGMRPGPQGKKNRRGGGKMGGANGGGGGAKDLKDMKAKRRKKPAGGESSVTMSPVDSLESPHSYTVEAAAGSTAANSPPLITSPSVRPLLPPVSHMLGQQQGWVGMAKHGYSAHMFGHMLPHQMAQGHAGLQQHHGSGMLTPMNVTMSREQLPPIVTFQMMTAGGGQGGILKPGQQQGVLQVQAPGQSQGQNHGQQSAHMHCSQGMMYPMPDVAIQHGMQHPLPHPHGQAHSHAHSHTLPHTHSLAEAQARQQVTPYQSLQSPVDKYPTPPSQHSYATHSSDGTPGHPAQPANEHPYLTPSPESPDPWSSSSPHSNSDWSDVTTSPTPLGNPHTLSHRHRTHIPEQAPLLQLPAPQTSQQQQQHQQQQQQQQQLQSQPLQQQSQQQQQQPAQSCSSVYA
uniref:Notch receptor 2 n=1 Tax=Astyanax mexicanus TaxID=7994 RepID=A0A8B9KKB2_ASTMX